MNLGRERRIWSRTWPFALLCVLNASRWLIEGAFSTTGSSAWSEAVGCLFVAACLLVWTRLGRQRRNQAPRGGSSPYPVMTAAIVIAGVPIGTAIAGRSLNSNNITLALALCPVVIAVVVSASGQGDGADLTGLLWPGLAGVAGLLLLVPEPSFGAWRPWIGMIAVPLLVGGAAGASSSAKRASPDQSLGDLRALAAGLGCAAALLSLLAFFHGWAGSAAGISLPAAALDGATALLTLVALVRIGPVRWSAQFLLVPLLGLGEGVVVLRPLLDWRSYLAFGLLAMSAAYQWMALAGSVDPAMDPDATSRVPER